MGRFSIKHRDDFERTGNWSLARRSLGLSAFGMNLVDIPQGGDIPSHDETNRDQEEVFVVLSGEPTIVIDGEAHTLRPGSFARLDSDCYREVRNDGAETASILIVSAPSSSGYKPMDWA